jgi:FkbM family methyltransferase
MHDPVLRALPLVVQSFNYKFKGVIHAGLHKGQEMDLYSKIGIQNIIGYEPIPSIYLESKNKFPNIKLLNKAVGNMNGKIKMNIETVNEGQSSSILQIKDHIKFFPKVSFEYQIESEIVRLDSDIENKSDYDILIIDVQGYELEVLKGAQELLKNNIKIIVAELNKDELYEKCPLYSEIDNFLVDFGFKRVLTEWKKECYGDGLYIKL